MSYILTFVASNSASPISERHISQTGEILNRHALQQICAPVWLAPEKAVDIGISDKAGKTALNDLRKELYADAIDVFISPVEGRRKKLLLADMDSTIVDSETLDELADFAGLKDKIATLTAKAMEVQLDFQSALRERVSLLKDLPVEALEKTLFSDRYTIYTTEKSRAINRCLL